MKYHNELNPPFADSAPQFSFKADYIDSGFYEVSADTAKKLAGGELPRHGRQKLVRDGKLGLMLQRTMKQGKQVWAVYIYHGTAVA